MSEFLKYRRDVFPLILALFFMSLGGWLLHLRIHPPGERLFFVVPFGFGLVTTFVLPLLFNHPRTVAWAYLVTMASVAVGTVTMAYFSWEQWGAKGPMPVTFGNLVLRTTFPDIVILATKAPLAHAILRKFRPAGDGR
jgi:hypothetical protein